MKKFTFIALAITAVLGVTSCTEKEGVYSPKMKMDKYYYIADGQQYLYCSFNWDGDKLVSISDGNETRYTIAYDDKNRISSVTYDRAIFNYTYDGNLLNRITTGSFYGDSIIMDFTHDGKKITNIKTTYFLIDKDRTTKGMHFDFASKALGLMMPSQICKSIDDLNNIALQKAVTKDNGAEIRSTNIVLTWDGKNISRVENKRESETATVVTYEYDNNPSPFCNLLICPDMLGSLSLGEYFSSNNITRSVTNYNNGHDSKTETYTYEYGEKNYPIKVINTTTVNYDYGKNSYPVKGIHSYTDTAIITYL